MTNDERLTALGDTPGSDACGCTRLMLAQIASSDSPGRDLVRAAREREAIEKAREQAHYTVKHESGAA